MSPPEEEGSPEEEIHVDIPVPEPEPVWSNPRTEDSGEDGFSILLKKEKGIGWILLLLGCVGAGVALIKRRERK